MRVSSQAAINHIFPMICADTVESSAPMLSKRNPLAISSKASEQPTIHLSPQRCPSCRTGRFVHLAVVVDRPIPSKGCRVYATASKLSSYEYRSGTRRHISYLIECICGNANMCILTSSIHENIRSGTHRSGKRNSKPIRHIESRSRFIPRLDEFRMLETTP